MFDELLLRDSSQDDQFKSVCFAENNFDEYYFVRGKFCPENFMIGILIFI